LPYHTGADVKPAEIRVVLVSPGSTLK